jgi:hypothetical protein
MNETTIPPRSGFLWVERPKVRETLDILIFSLSTLTVCMWSTLPLDTSKSRYTKREFGFRCYANDYTSALS